MTSPYAPDSIGYTVNLIHWSAIDNSLFWNIFVRFDFLIFHSVDGLIKIIERTDIETHFCVTFWIQSQYKTL